MKTRIEGSDPRCGSLGFISVFSYSERSTLFAGTALEWAFLSV